MRTWNYTYDSLGNLKSQEGTGGVKEAYLLYTNQFKDSIGCYDYGARVYCPKWYHFTSADPVTANVFDPQGLNRYAYVQNNPYTYVDPTGKKVKKEGASATYHSAGYSASLQAAFDSSSGGGGAYYSVTYQIEGDEERKIDVPAEEYETYQEKAKQYAQKSVYGAFTAHVEQEYLVHLLEARQGREYEYRSGLQQAIENKWGQIVGGAIAGAGVGAATGAVTVPIIGAVPGVVIGGIIGGVAVGGSGALADLSEKEATNGEITFTDLEIAYVDTGVSAASAVTGSALGFSENVVVDMSTDIVISGSYEATKPYIFTEDEHNG